MPVHLLVARDPLILSEAVQACLPPGSSPARHYAADLDIDTVFNQLGIADLFATERTFYYVDILDMKPGKRDAERLSEILAGLTPETTLVCTQLFSDPEKRSDEDRRMKTQAFALWTKHARLQDLRRQSDPENAMRWLIERAQKMHGMQISREQAARLLHLSADQLALAAAELGKLALSMDAGSAGRLSNELLEATVQGSPAAKFYDLADSVMNCAPEADLMLTDWYRSSPETFKLIYELKRRFSGMRQLRRGGNVYPPFFARSLQQFQRRYSGERFARSVELLAQLEQDLKSGTYAAASSKDAELMALQVFVVDLRRISG